MFPELNYIYTELTTISKVSFQTSHESQICIRNKMLLLQVLLGGLILAGTGLASTRNKTTDGKKPIILDRTGGFQIGGRVMVNPNNPNQSLSCDHGYVE